MSRRTFLLTGLGVALLLAVAATLWASGHPDGLEHVAAETGFADSGRSRTALSGTLANFAALLAVLALGSGLFWLLRRRDGQDGA